MKKAILATVIGLSATAAQAEYFVSGALGAMASEQEVDVSGAFGSSNTVEETGSSGTLALAGGVKQEKFRVYAEYANTTFEEADVSFLTANADYIHAVSQSASLFAGASLGVANLTWNDSDDNVALGLDGETASSGAAGFRFGGLINAGQGQLEIAYRSFSADLETEVTVDTIFGSATAKSTITSSSGIYVGYNLAF